MASLLLFPGQGLPFLGGGLSQDRSAKYLPPAQEAVQEDHDFQGDQPPSTNVKTTRMKGIGRTKQI